MLLEKNLQELRERAKALNAAAYETIDQPEFREARRWHDWRNHVPARIQAGWQEIGESGRLVAFIMAEELAQSEPDQFT